MKKKFYLIPIISLFLFSALAGNKLNPIPTPEARASKLVTQLSLSEKISQLKIISYESIKPYVTTQGAVSADSLKKYFPDGVGGIGLDKDLDPVVYVNVVNSIRHYNNTMRHPIPPMFIGEGLHGFMAKGATVFPQAIALGCSWDPEILEKVFAATALEASSRGVKQLFSPVLDLAREPRFGRTEEMYSEDPYLVSMCGQAAVLGFQGYKGLPDATQVAATLKHFAGHGQPEGGRNIAPINISQYDLMNSSILPFETCMNAGALSVMPSYNEMNGIPNHGSKWLLQDILHDKLGFTGLITSDQDAIREMYCTHAIVPTLGGAAKLAIENGVDLDLRFLTGGYDELENLVKSGRLNEKYIDESVTRFLTLKFKLGMFEQKDINVTGMLAVTNNKEHKALALEVAQKSLVLLKNNNNTLPLEVSKLKTVAVIGPLAKGVHFGGYTVEPRHGIDVLQGIQNFAINRFQVVYAQGCKLAIEESSFWQDGGQTPNDEASDLALLDSAVKVASQSDVIVLALGETVAFSREAWGENHLGDRDNLDLLGRQNQLVEALLKTGKPVVVLMLGGRPLSFNYVAGNVPAILQVFYPGQEGGTAIADILFGKVNPSGKLSVTIPKSVGQLPCYYSRKPSRIRSYIGFKGSEPLFPFGFGLSYTNFKYSSPTIDKMEITKTQSVKVSVQVTNTGNVSGEEVVQLYIHDLVSAGVRPVQELKDFARVNLQPNETKTVSFTITPDKLSYYNPDLQKVIEPGDFDVLVGRSSVDVQTLRFKVTK